MRVADNQKIKYIKSENSQLDFQRIWNIYTFQKDCLLNYDKIPDSILVFVNNGRLEISINEEEHFVAYPHEMFIIPSMAPFCLKTLAYVQVMSCVVDEQSLLKQLDMNDSLVSVDSLQESCFKLPVKKPIFNFLRLLKRTIKDGLDSNFYLEMKRNELFLLFLVYYTREEMTIFLSKLSSKDFQFKKAVMENYLSVKNVGELAVKTNYSTSGFIKKFNSNFGESPYKWMQKQKAKQIYLDIYHRKKSLKEIASDYKFSSYQHFAKFCKAYLGSPPTATIEKCNFDNK
jgi:AraC-like DNA-binding protein